MFWFNSGNAPVATIAIGTGLVGFLTGADFGQIRQGMEGVWQADNSLFLMHNWSKEHPK